MRKDLGMRKGKLIAQGSHASMAFLANYGQNIMDDGEGPVLCTPLSEVQARWIREAFTKICVYVKSEEELLAVHQAALDAGLVSHLITDKGLTEFNNVPTNTCIAIGPDYADKIDAVTGNLELY